MQRFLALLAIAALAPALSGCFDGKDRVDDEGAPAWREELSPSQYEVMPAKEMWVESTVDGQRINNAVYLPDGEGPFPVFINFSPYWGDTAMAMGDAFSRYMVQEYVPRGYAVVLSAIRGTGHSEGCFQIGGDLELQDTHDVVDYFSKQPWSNGNVAAGGKSYDSTTQNGMIAKVPHDALKGIFHVSGITDMYRYNYYGGVPYASGPIFNTYYYFQGTNEYNLPLPLIGSPTGGAPGEEDPESLARLIDDVACTELPQMQLSGVGSGAHGLKDAYWQERDWTTTIGASTWEGSIFFVHGFQDWNVKPDHMVPWVTNLPEPVKEKTLGWLHQWVEGGTGHVYPMRTDWNETMLRWMDHVLKDKDTAMDQLWGFDLQTLGEDGKQVWYRTATWPPAAEIVASSQSGPNLSVMMADATHITGGAWAEVTATVSDPESILSLRLEKQDGTWVSEGVLRALYRDGLESPAITPPGEQTVFRVDFYPFDVHLEAGEGLVLVAGEAPLYTLATEPQLATVEYAGITLHLPYAADAKLLDPQPTPMECFTC